MSTFDDLIKIVSALDDKQKVELVLSVTPAQTKLSIVTNESSWIPGVATQISYAGGYRSLDQLSAGIMADLATVALENHKKIPKEK